MNITQQQVIDRLESFAAWMDAGTMLCLMDYDTTETNKRRLRAIAAACPREIISGPLGYKLRSKATREEINHCANRLKSQARDMNNRAAAILGEVGV